MSRRTFFLPQEIHDYLVDVGVREPPVLTRLRRETASLPRANMQIAPEQGAFMAMLVELMGARRCLEIGTFTGYSALAMALALPEEGRLITCDVSEEWTAMACRFWAEAGVADRIELRLGPALDTLDALLADGAEETFDFAFIDADKENLAAYFERCLRLVRPGGLIAVDNTLWHGKVVDDGVRDADTEAIRAFNRALRDDERVSLVLVPIGDGLTLARRRA